MRIWNWIFRNSNFFFILRAGGLKASKSAQIGRVRSKKWAQQESAAPSPSVLWCAFVPKRRPRLALASDLRVHGEGGAAVLLAARFILSGTDLHFFSVTDDLKAFWLDAGGDKGVAGGLGTLFAEGEVVFG